MKISIIIPYHDYPRYLIDCLASVQAQGISDLETVLVTNYEDGELLRIINDFATTINIKHVVSEKDASVAVNRNLGLEHATGEYVYFLDSDDYLDYETLPLMLTQAKVQNAEVISGKRKGTWYKRDAYYEIQLKKEQEALLADPIVEPIVIEELDMTSHEYTVKKMVAQKRGLSGISATNVLIKRSLIESLQLRFDEQLRFYSDLPFMIKLIDNTKVYAFVPEALYIKRNHNDSINMPALSQVKYDNRFEEYIESYRQACTGLAPNALIKIVLDRKMVSYYCGKYAKSIRRSEDARYRTSRFKIMQDIIKQINPFVIKTQKRYRRRLLHATIAGDLKKVKRLVTIDLFFKRSKSAFKNRKILEVNKTLYRHRYLKQKIEPTWVVFESFFGKSYSDSPKYIYEYLAQHYPGKYQFIWVLDDKKTVLPYGGIKVKRFSRKYAYYLAKSKYLVFNVRQPLWLKKRPEQKLVQTWHGTPLKRLVFDQEEVTAGSPTYKMQFYKKRAEWDYLVAANQFSSDVFRSCFMYEGEMLETGYPRNDLLNHPDKASKAGQIKAKLNIPSDKKLILYAPTWRDDEFIDTGKYKFQLQLDLAMLQRELGNDYVILLRTHYYIASSLDLTGFDNFVFNVSTYNDITELYLISDILITDYSSVFFDYATLRRPMLFFTYDLDKYRDMLRGFYISMEEELPGPLVFTTEEIVEAIKNIDQLEMDYKEKYDQFFQKFCSWEDGQASKRVVGTVFEN